MGGTTKIQLINQKTKKVDHEYTDHNIFTNAISNAFAIPTAFQRSLGQDESSAIIRYQNELGPLNRRGLGGILLWDDFIEENPNIVYPPSGLNNIGYAGGNYSGDNSFRGTLNSLETGPMINPITKLTIGYRNVWDFDTSKCNNKLIKAISLTHVNCGNNGMRARVDGSSQGYMRNNTGMFDKDSSSHYILGFLDEECSTILCINTVSDTEVRFYKKRKVNFKKIGVNDLHFNTTSASFDTISITFPSAPKRSGNAFLIDDTIHLINRKSDNVIEHILINKNDYTYTTKAITLTGHPTATSNYNVCCFFNNCYYIMATDGRILCMSNTGGYITTISSPYGVTNMDFSIVDERLILAHNTYSTTTWVALEIDKANNSRYIQSAIVQLPIGKIIKSPLKWPLYISDINYMQMNASVYYIGSINNLEVPISKTSEYSMKIIYEITDI